MGFVFAATFAFLLWGTPAFAGSAPDSDSSGIVTVALSDTQIVNQYGCSGCHKIGGKGGTTAPDLQGIFERRDEAWIRIQIQHPRQHNPQTLMPDFGLTDEQVVAIVEALRAVDTPKRSNNGRD